MAQAGAANDFAAANRSQQATLLQQWAADPQPERLPLLEALKQENVVIDDAKHAFVQQGDALTPLDGDAKPQGDTKKVWLNNRLRILIANALSAHRLVSTDSNVRLQAAKSLQREAQADQLPLLT
ncbi:urea ABC transporter permease subunit UrtB, partial [Salmonella enterica subsp. enterica]